MNTAEEVVKHVCALRPNPYEDHLSKYVNDLDLKIKKEVLGETSPSTDSDTLALSAPYDRIYEIYLYSVIDFLNGEFGRYENTYGAFCTEWDKLCASINNLDDTNNADNNTSEIENEVKIKIW